jgi:DNA-binding transcriptional LysR family regulator
VDAAFRIIGAAPEIANEGRSSRAILAFSSEGIGTAVWPSSVSTDLSKTLLIFQGRELTIPTTLVWRSASVDTEAIRFMANVLGRHCDKPSVAPDISMN